MQKRPITLKFEDDPKVLDSVMFNAVFVDNDFKNVRILLYCSAFDPDYTGSRETKKGVSIAYECRLVSRFQLWVFQAYLASHTVEL